MDRLYTFTNRRGQQNHGIIAERTDLGAYVLFDVFDIAPGVQLPARYSFVPDAPNRYLANSDTRRDVTQLTGVVRWVDERIAEIAKVVLTGDFDAWWQAHRSEVMSDMYARKVA